MVEIYSVALLVSGAFLVHFVLRFLLYRSGIYWDPLKPGSPFDVSDIVTDAGLNVYRVRLEMEGKEDDLRQGRAVREGAQERSSRLADARTVLSRVVLGGRRAIPRGETEKAGVFSHLAFSDLLVLVCLGIGIAMTAGAE